MRNLRWALVHTPGDPAVSAWTAAATAVDAPQPRLVPWAGVLNGSETFGDGEIVRTERLTPVAPKRYGGSRERYERFAAALDTLSRRIAADNAQAGADAAATLLALDRKRCTEHLAAAGVPVPEAGDRVIRQRFAEPCDAVLTLARVRTRTGYELHHTLRRQYHDRANEGDVVNKVPTVRELLSRDDETFGVGELPTAYLNRAQHRFRFAVINGRVTHAAGRLAEKVVAREYYGGRRREIDAYHQRFGAAAWRRLIDIAEQAATAFPGIPAIGVDIAASQVGGPDVVYDIDPFGARLPAALGLPGSAGEGLDVAATVLQQAVRPQG